jgi:hypothetical protein
MSHYEFFAEMYALYYDYDDPKRKAIPAAVAKWMDENIAKATPKIHDGQWLDRRQCESWKFVLFRRNSRVIQVRQFGQATHDDVLDLLH